VVTCEVAKFFTVEVPAALPLPDAAEAPVDAVEAVFVAVVVVVVVVGAEAAEPEELVVAEAVLAAAPLTADASLVGRPVDAAALETGPWLVATINGAYWAAP